MTNVGSNTCSNPDKNGEDPAEFLLSNKKYHDCYVTVGDPETDEVETIGVSSVDLIACSSVFRQLLTDSVLSDPSGANTHIRDVSPATFKLMLRYVYGGKLPQLTPDEAVALALCADKYNIERLVEKATKRLKPSSAEDIFTALICTAYISCPRLEHEVIKIIQEETRKIVQNRNFLDLDENCVLFVVKQGVMNIGELELWENLVRWGKTQVENNPAKTLRNCFTKILPYIRLLVLTHKEIIKHVLPTKILTPDEYMELTLAVENKQKIQSPTLCQFAEKRIMYKDNARQKVEDGALCFNRTYIFKLKNLMGLYDAQLSNNGRKAYSTLTITPARNIMIENLTFECFNNQSENQNHAISIDIKCNVVVCTFVQGLQESVQTLNLRGRAAPGATITFPIRRENGQPLILEVGKIHSFRITTTPSLPTFKVIQNRNFFYDSFTFQDSYGMTVNYQDPLHIKEITYKVQCGVTSAHGLMENLDVLWDLLSLFTYGAYKEITGRIWESGVKSLMEDIGL